MIIRDYVTPKERLNFSPVIINDFYFIECMGCGRNSEEIVLHEGCTFEELDDNSRRTVEGNWYCHIDCFRDSH